MIQSMQRDAVYQQKQTHTLYRGTIPVVVEVWSARELSGALPVMLIHGWGGTGTYWQETAEYLSQTVDVIVPDLPGTGRSQPVSAAQNMYDQVETLRFILAELGIERVQLVGHSMGSAMSLLLAADNPHLVERAALTALTFFMTQAQIDLYQRIMSGFKVAMRFRPDWLASVPGMTRMMAKQYFYRIPDDKALLEQGLRDYLTLDRATALACAENATDDAIKQAGERVQIATLLIACRQDNMMPLENVDFTLDILGDSQVRWIEECGHLPMVEKPATYQSILQEFLEL